MRLVGATLFFLGLIATIVCAMNGLNQFFAFNGRHEVAQSELVPDGHTHTTFSTWPGRRYTPSVRIVFDPAHVADREGMAAVEAQFPLVITVADKAGTKLSETKGWLDPNEPPNVFYSRPLREPGREITAERLSAGFLSSSEASINVDVDLGADRIGQYPVIARRLVIYDDALPPGVRNAAIGAGIAMLAMLAGLVIAVSAFVRRRRARAARRKRSGVPRQGPV